MKKDNSEIVKFVLKYSFPITILIAFFLAFQAGGYVRDGMFMGFVSTIAIWSIVTKFTPVIKYYMGKFMLLTDFILSTICFICFTSFIGPGLTLTMCSITQAVCTSFLVAGLRMKYKESTVRVQEKGKNKRWKTMYGFR